MVELLAPAGDLDKLKTALIYGADAVFVGGQNFSLRARASNFSIDDLKNAAQFAHRLGKKIYVTTNIIPHQEDLDGLVPYLKALENAKVDAIITASPAIIHEAKANTNLEIHLSTQQSAINANTVNYWYKKGVKRIVLGRELSLTEINGVSAKTDADLEVFIHGGMCMSYSGRCSLSDNMTGRDANRGGCAHSCRWSYTLEIDGAKQEKLFSMSSKDLQALKQTVSLIEANVKSLKIEGRMKSQHYIATVVKTYRMLIDEYMKTGKINDYSIYESLISKSENRETSFGYLEGLPGLEQQLYSGQGEKPNQEFIGFVLEDSDDKNLVKIEQRNFFNVGDKIEVFSPNEEERYFTLTKMYDEEFNEIEVARHPKQVLYILIPFKVVSFSMLRKSDSND
ncbi:MAG: U32 family peptidase [Acholeplasma sp.]|nr:U32 family peptidase [Acholeplasma sp.]